MSSWVVRSAAVALLAAVPIDPVVGQDAQDILDQVPVRVKAASPVTNGTQINFGAAVALDGDILLVGAPGEDSATDPMVFDSGAVYVFQREGAGWVEKQQLTSPSEAAFEEFGSSVGVALGDDNVDYLIVGAPGAGGSAYIFKRVDGGSWDLDATLSQDDPQTGDLFGTSVAIDYFEPINAPKDDKVFVAAVGAPQNRDPAGSGSQEGSVSIFQPTGDPPTWGLTEEFFGLVNGDLMGASLAMASDWVVAGSEGLDGTGFNGGGAHVFAAANQQPAGWYKYNLAMIMQPSAPEVGVGQGLSVAAEYNPSVIVSGAAIGFPLSDQVEFNAGLVLVFQFGVSSPITESAVIEPTGLGQGAAFGTSVALSNQILAVGAPGVGTDGAVFLYDMGPTIETWNLAGSLSIPDLPPPGGCSGGTALALDRVTLTVGCPSSNGYENEGTFVSVGAFFTDGFESGDTAAWSSTSP